MSSRNTHTYRSSLASSCGRRRSRLAALRAKTSNWAAIAGKRRWSSMAWSSSWRSTMCRLAAEQLVVHAQVQHGCAELRHRLGGGRTNEIADGVEGGHHALIEQQADGGLDLRLGRARRQMQPPH